MKFKHVDTFLNIKTGRLFERNRQRMGMCGKVAGLGWGEQWSRMNKKYILVGYINVTMKLIACKII